MTAKRMEMRLIRPKMGVGVKTWIALSAIFWLPVIILTLLINCQFQEQIGRESIDTVKLYFRGSKEVFGERVKILESLLAHAAGREEVRGAFAKRDAQRLQSIFFDIERSNPFAKIWIAVDENQRVIGRRSNKVGDTLRIGDALTKALATGDPVTTTELVTKEFLETEAEEISKRVTNVGLVQFVISPVRDKNGVSGAVIAGVPLTGDSWLGNTIYNKFGAEMAIFAGEPPESSFLHATASLPRNTWKAGQSLPKEPKESLLLGKPFYGTVNIDQSEHMVSFEPIFDSQNRIIGTFGVSVPAENIHEDYIWLLLKAVAITAVLGLALAAVIVGFAYMDIVRPIKFLSKAMENFGKGETDISLDLKTGDEFEKLGNGFNEMADGIRKREERLRKHYEVAKLLMSTLDLKDLVDKMMKIVLDVTRSQMGILYLCEEGEEEMLVPHVHYGTRSELRILKGGEGHPGRVAKDKKTFVIRPPKGSAEESMELGYASVAPHEVAYIPLIYKEKALGVLVLGTVNEYDDEDMQIFEYLSNQISISLDNAIMHQKIQELSITDPLTRLYNRRYMNARMAEEWSRSVRYNQPLSLLLSDADNFKKINDSFGHDRGDEVLKGIAEIVRKNIRKEDIGARFGGEEFVVILPNTTSKDALNIAERIRTTSEAKMYSWMGRSVTLSIGLATFPEISLKNSEELIQAADQAMYKAKVGGKNRVVTSEGFTAV